MSRSWVLSQRLVYLGIWVRNIQLILTYRAVQIRISRWLSFWIDTCLDGVGEERALSAVGHCCRGGRRSITDRRWTGHFWSYRYSDAFQRADLISRFDASINAVCSVQWWAFDLIVGVEAAFGMDFGFVRVVGKRRAGLWQFDGKFWWFQRRYNVFVFNAQTAESGLKMRKLEKCNKTLKKEIKTLGLPRCRSSLHCSCSVDVHFRRYSTNVPISDFYHFLALRVRSSCE